MYFLMLKDFKKTDSFGKRERGQGMLTLQGSSMKSWTQLSSAVFSFNPWSVFKERQMTVHK